MNLEVIKNTVTSKAGRTILLGKKHSPVILFGAGVAGVIGTTVLACRATLKVDEILDDADKKRLQIKTMVVEDYTAKDRNKDLRYLQIQTMFNVAKLYAPAALLGATSITALTGSHIVLNRRNVALTAAYKVIEDSFERYRNVVREDLGEEKEQEYYRGVREIAVHDTKKGEISTGKQYINPGGGPTSQYARFFGTENPNWSPQPEYNLLFLRAQQNYANHKLQAHGHVLLNDIHDALGMDRTKAGCVVGWVKDNGDNYIDFGIFDTRANDRFFDFVHGDEGIWLDFNVDGVVYDLIERG